MGLFDKTRHGKLTATDNTGRHFLWTLPNFKNYKAGVTLDSENVVCYTKAKFHFHMSVGQTGDIGLYIHFKTPPIPKYSYYFANIKGEMMRQHTAHTIPSDTERCGHWNVCTRQDMISFLTNEDTLLMYFSFDDDSISLKRNNTAVAVMWTIPSFFQQCLNPFSSKGFFKDGTLLVIRADVKQSTNELVFFMFCRKGTVPSHSMEIIDQNGSTITKVEKNENGVQTLTISREALKQAIGLDGSLFVRVELFSGSNPLEALNMAPQMTSKDDEEGHQQDLGRTVTIGTNKEAYLLMDPTD